MSLEKRLKDSAFVIGTETGSCWVVRLSRVNEELGVVAKAIREKRDKIQKVIDEEKAFRKRTAINSYAGEGRRGFSEIEMDKFETIVKELNWLLGLLVEKEEK